MQTSRLPPATLSEFKGAYFMLSLLNYGFTERCDLAYRLRDNSPTWRFVGVSPGDLRLLLLLHLQLSLLLLSLFGACLSRGSSRGGRDLNPVWSAAPVDAGESLGCADLIQRRYRCRDGDALEGRSPTE